MIKRPLAVNVLICRNKVARRDGEKLSRIPNREALSDGKLKVGYKSRRYLNALLYAAFEKKEKKKTSSEHSHGTRNFGNSRIKSIGDTTAFCLREIGRTPRSSDKTRPLTPSCLSMHVYISVVLYRIFRK